MKYSEKKRTKNEERFIGIYHFSPIFQKDVLSKDGNQSCYQIEDEKFWFQHRNNIIAESVKKYNKENVFDVGGGNGFVSKRLQDDGLDAYLIEPGVDGSKNAKNRGVNNVICSTIQDIGIDKKSVYSIGLFDVLEHIKEDIHSN